MNERDGEWLGSIITHCESFFNVNNIITAITRPRDENLREEDDRRRKELVRGWCGNNDNITARLRDSACL